MRRLLPLMALTTLFTSSIHATRVMTIVNRCPTSINLFINGQAQGTLNQDGGSTSRTYDDNFSGLIYSTANGGQSNGAQSTRAGFYGQTNYYYIVKDPNHLNVGISIVPRILLLSATGNICAPTTCDSTGCPTAYTDAPTSFPSPSGSTAPPPPLFSCPGTDVGYTITFCPEKTLPPAGFTTIHPNSQGNKCLDVRGAIFSDGTVVQIYDCNGTAAQRWVTTKGGAPTRVQLAGTNFCLDAGSNSPNSGSTTKIRPCVDNSPAQTWVVNGGMIKLSSKNQCVDLTDGKSQNGNRIQTWTCQNPGAPNQSWGL